MFVLESFGVDNQDECLSNKDRSTTGKKINRFEQSFLYSVANSCNHFLPEARLAYFIQQSNRTLISQSNLIFTCDDLFFLPSTQRFESGMRNV